VDILQKNRKRAWRIKRGGDTDGLNENEDYSPYWVRGDGKKRGLAEHTGNKEKKEQKKRQGW